MLFSQILIFIYCIARPSSKLQSAWLFSYEKREYERHRSHSSELSPLSSNDDCFWLSTSLTASSSVLSKTLLIKHFFEMPNWRWAALLLLDSANYRTFILKAVENEHHIPLHILKDMHHRTQKPHWPHNTEMSTKTNNATICGYNAIRCGYSCGYTFANMDARGYQTTTQCIFRLMRYVLYCIRDFYYYNLFY